MRRPSSDAEAAVEYLRTIVGHHTWAMLALIDRCRELGPEELGLSTPGGFGSVHATMAHLVQADARYLRRILREELVPAPERLPAIDELRSEMESQAGRWQEVLGRLGELDATVPAEPDEEPPYPEIEHAVGLLVTQAIHHGNEHRAHVCSILGAHGLAVPDLSGWEYVRLIVTGGGTARPGWVG